MPKTKISSIDLIWILREKLASFDDCSPSIAIAVVPSNRSWTAVTSKRDRERRPASIKRIELIQRQLRDVYALEKD